MARGLAFVVGLCLLAAAIAIPAARHVDDSGADARRGEDAHYPACCARSLIDPPTAAAPHHLAAQMALLVEARGIRSEIAVLLGRQSLFGVRWALEIGFGIQFPCRAPHAQRLALRCTHPTSTALQTGGVMSSRGKDAIKRWMRWMERASNDARP